MNGLLWQLSDMGTPLWFGDPPTGDRARALLTVYLATTLGLPLTLFLMRLASRRAKTRGLPKKPSLVTADRIREGWTATIELPTQRGSSRLQASIASADRNYVALSISDVPSAAVAAGTPLRLFVVGDTAAYWFASIARDYVVRNDIKTLYVERPAWIEKVQRREHFRVAARITATLSTIESVAELSQMLRGEVQDISAGGFAIALPAQISPGTRVRLRLASETIGECSYEARVVRSAATPYPGPFRYRAHCELMHLTPENREAIIAYCFSAQRGMAHD